MTRSTTTEPAADARQQLAHETSARSVARAIERSDREHATHLDREVQPRAPGDVEGATPDPWAKRANAIAFARFRRSLKRYWTVQDPDVVG